MKRKLKNLLARIPRPAKVFINLTVFGLVLFLFYIIIGSPPFSFEQEYRRKARKEFVGPGEVLDIVDTEQFGKMLIAETESGAIRYQEDTCYVSYREKVEGLAVLTAYDLGGMWYYSKRVTLPIFLVDDYPKAVRAEMDFTIFGDVNNQYYEEKLHLESVREKENYFYFEIVKEAQGETLGAEGFAVNEFCEAIGSDWSVARCVYPTQVRLYDEDDELIFDKELLLSSSAYAAHDERGEMQRKESYLPQSMNGDNININSRKYEG